MVTMSLAGNMDLTAFIAATQIGYLPARHTHRSTVKGFRPGHGNVRSVFHHYRGYAFVGYPKVDVVCEICVSA